MEWASKRLNERRIGFNGKHLFHIGAAINSSTQWKTNGRRARTNNKTIKINFHASEQAEEKIHLVHESARYITIRSWFCVCTVFSQAFAPKRWEPQFVVHFARVLMEQELPVDLSYWDVKKCFKCSFIALQSSVAVAVIPFFGLSELKNAISRRKLWIYWRMYLLSIH